MNPRETAERVLNRLKNSAGDGRWDDHLSLANCLMLTRWTRYMEKFPAS